MTEPRLDGPVLVFDLLGAGDVDGAARAAARFRPQVVLDAIDYHDVAEHAERYRDLVLAWMPLVDPLSRPEIAYWYADNSVADLASLDDQASAACMVVASAGDAAERLAGLLGGLGFLAAGPVAGLSRSRAAALAAEAERLRAVGSRLSTPAGGAEK